MTEKGLGWGHLKPVSDAFNRAMAAPEARRDSPGSSSSLQ